METPLSPRHPRIALHSSVCHGQPTVRGLRYPVWQVLEYLAAGRSEAEILADYPDLEAEDFQACLLYAVFWLKKIGTTLVTNGLTPEEIAAGHTRQPLTKQEFRAHLEARGTLPTDGTLK